MNNKELINNIPSSWETFKLKDYLKCIDIPISEGNQDRASELLSGLDNTMRVISALTNISVDELEVMDFSLIHAMGSKLSFMLKMPENGLESTIKWKQLDEVTYNDFVTFLIVSKDAVHSMPGIIKLFSKEPLTDEQINNMSVSEVYTGFFMLRKYVRRFIRHLILREALKLVKMQTLTPLKLKFRGKKGN